MPPEPWNGRRTSSGDYAFPMDKDFAEWMSHFVFTL
jgi:hypothetical protein